MKYTLICIATLIASNIYSQVIESTLIFSYNEAGVRQNQESYCPLCCPNNLLANGSFEEAKVGWKIDSNAMSNTANGGALAAVLCQETSDEQNEVSQRLEAWTGATYTFSAYLKAADVQGELRMIFLNAREQPIGDSIVFEASPSEYQEFTIVGRAQDSVRYIEVKVVVKSAGCLYVDDLCLTADKFQSDDPCKENSLSNAGFNTESLMSWWHTLETEVQNFNAKNCSPFGGGGGQTVAAEAGQKYTLKTTVQVAEKDFDAYVGMEFIDENGRVIGNPIRKIVYNQNLEEITLVGIAPENTVALSIFFIKKPGNGCLITRDWCLTSTAHFEPPVENTLKLYAYRTKYTSTLVWHDSTWTSGSEFVVERWNKEGEYAIIGEVGAEAMLRDGRYIFIDEKPEQGTNTYRVRKILYNDYFMTSNKAPVWFPQADIGFILVPNPAEFKVDLIFEESLASFQDRSIIQVHDIHGRICKELIVDSDLLSRHYRLYLDDLIDGVYIVTLRQGQSKPISRKLVLTDF